MSLNNKIKLGFVVQTLPKCEVRLGTDNEILIKHAALMTGYFKEPEMTKEAFSIDGFLHTGDEGYIDEEGFLKITGRVKDLFKTTKAKYVAPSPIEIKIACNTDIEQVCVVGADLPQPIALIILSEAGKKKIKEELYTGLKEMMEQINASLDTHEELEKVVVLSDEWTVENGLVTPTFKIKRREIEKKYLPNYERWYNQKGMIVE